MVRLMLRPLVHSCMRGGGGESCYQAAFYLSLPNEHLRKHFMSNKERV